MEILAVLGSPRKNGNTSLLLKEYLRGVRESGKECNIHEIFLSSKKISPCTGCEGCSKGDMVCVINDDMKGLYELIKKADTIIIASPVYWWHVTAQMKIFIDRFYGLEYSLYEGKNMVFLSTHGSNEEESGVKTAESSLKDMCAFIKMHYLYRYSVETGSLRFCDNLEAQKEVFELGKKLI